MDQSRRTAVRALVAAALAVSLPGTAKAQQSLALGELTRQAASPVAVIIPVDYKPPVDAASRRSYHDRLVRSVMDFIQQAYADRPLPAWDRRLSEIDLERRVDSIAWLIMDAVRQNLSVHPIDPAWLMAQIMAESFFFEFAISSAFAGGICQFIASTARGYNMITAGDKPEHRLPPYLLTEYADKLEEYNGLRNARKNALKEAYKDKPAEDFLKTLLLQVSQGQAKREDAARTLDRLAKAERLAADAKSARLLFKQYLLANIETKNVFDQTDVNQLAAFDERFTLEKPAASMVVMMTRALRARSGNIIAATAGYNAGLGNTTDSGIYEPYGAMPALQETVGYVSRIFINHYEITRRL